MRNVIFNEVRYALALHTRLSQWRDEVEREINNHINRQYMLVYRSPKDDCEEDFIFLNSVEYPLVKKSDNRFKYTEILRFYAD